MKKTELEQLKKIQEYAELALKMKADHLDGEDVIAVINRDMLELISKIEEKKEKIADYQKQYWQKNKDKLQKYTAEYLQYYL